MFASALKFLLLFVDCFEGIANDKTNYCCLSYRYFICTKCKILVPPLHLLFIKKQSSSMLNVFRKPKEKSLSSSKELKDVQMHVYTRASGLIGRFLGRDLKIRIDGFEVTYVEDAATGRKAVRDVVVDSDSLSPMADVNENRFERLYLTLTEAERVARRTKNAILDVSRYPHVEYRVDHEDEHYFQGQLRMRGIEQPLRCEKKLEGPELVVTCPIDYTQHGALPYKHLLGLFSVKPTVEVVTRIPVKLLL